MGGHLTALRRTRVGPYEIGAARTLEQLAADLQIVPLAAAAAAAFPRRDLTEEEARLLSHGARLPWATAERRRGDAGWLAGTAWRARGLARVAARGWLARWRRGG